MQTISNAGNACTILIVDDEKSQRTILSDILEDSGYLVAQAATGEEALNILEGRNVDLILLDIIMPGLDGIETCRKIKKIDRNKSVPVIMLTALSNEDDVVRALDAGADDFINKSSEHKIIHARIKAHLRTKILFDKTERVRESEASVLDVVLDITSSRDIRKVLQLLTEKTSTQTGMDVSVLLIDELEQSATIIAYSDSVGNQDIQIDLDKYPEIRKVLLTGEPVFISDIENNSLLKNVVHILKEIHISSIIVVPLIFQDDLFGTLILTARSSKKIFDEEDIRLSKIMAGVASNAIRNSSIISQLKEQKTMLLETQKIANLGSWKWKVTENEISWSDNSHRILGFKPEEFNPNCDAFLTSVHPDDRERVKNEINLVLNEGKLLDIDYRVLLPGEETRILHSAGNVTFDDNGKPFQLLGTVQDVTERKRAEEELRFYSEISMNMSDAINLIRAKDAAIVYTNNKFNEMFGYKDGGLIGKNVTVLNANKEGASAEDVRNNIVECLNRSDRWTGEVQNKKKDDTLFWTYASIVKFNHFKFGDCYLSIQYDITECKRRQEEIKRSEKRLAEAQRIAHIGNWEWNIEKNTLYWSDEIYRIFGLKSQESGASYEAFLDAVHPDDREFVKKSADDAINGKEYYSIDLRIILPDLTERVVHEQAEIVRDEDGQPLRMVGTVQDITDRKRAEKALKQSEDRYNLAMQTANDGLWDRNLETGEIYFSARWKEMLGYKYDEIPNRREEWEQRVHPDDYQRVLEDLRRCCEGTEPYYMSEYRLRHKDGSYRWVRAKGAVVVGESGRPTHFAGSHVDITERKKMEEELLNAQKLESIGILAGGIAHDFNNILTAVMNNLYVAKSHIDEADEVYTILNSVEDAAMRATDLTYQLLTFSKGGAPIIKNVSIAEILKESVTFALRGSSLKSEFSIPSDLWPARIDAGQINQVISNLIINAWQAMNQGGIVTVMAQNVNITPEDGLPLKKGSFVKVMIKDKGAGMKEETLFKVFDPYFSTKDDGSGLGLATCYSIIKKHNGHISVESELGVGTTFTFYLPASGERIAIKKDSAKKTKRVTSGKRILVMDDDETLLAATGMILRNLGYEAEFAKDGVEAINLYAEAIEDEAPFDAVMMDLTIQGGMGGKETITKLKDIDPNAKVIVCSGYSDASVVSDFKSYGFCGALQKPYRTAMLKEELGKVIEDE